MSSKAVAIKELEKYNYSIKKWYNGKRKILSVISAPCNTSLIFKEIIEESLRNKERVLYAWSGKEVNKEIIKKINTNESYSYYLKEENDAVLGFINIENYKFIKTKYSLCIIDDITICELKSRNEIIEAFEHLFLYCKKIIIYSTEKLLPSGEILEVVSLNRKKPFVEPRYINTRINLEEEIPYKVYDYLKWFKKNSKRAIILIPNEKKANKIYETYTELIESKGIKINKYLDEYDIKIKDKLWKEKNNEVIILTNSIENYKVSDNINFIVLFSEEDNINCKKILFLCAQAGIHQNKELGEVIICCNEITKDLDKAKNICRSYNKNLWEKALVKY